ncbi:MAG TPA: HtaA domain-containing protein [Ilumatobacteraceae bacterium]|nr:HtaA domain-containing protein [Ilumatobacteraceae bacterium]
MFRSIDSRRRRWRAIGVTAALVAGGVVAVTANASAAPVAVTGGTIDWGVRQSFRNYVVGPIAAGTITASGGVTQAAANGPFQWPVTGGTSDSGSLSVQSSGTVVFTGHNDPAQGDLLEVRYSNLRVSITGTTGNLIADIQSRQFTGIGSPAGPLNDFPNLTFGALDLSGVTPTVGASSVSYANVPVTLTAAGVPAFGGFYPAGDALDPVSFTVNLAGAPGPGPSPDPRTITTGSLRWVLSQTAWDFAGPASLSQCRAAIAPATAVSGAWDDPAAGTVFGSTAGTYDPATGATTLQTTGGLVIGNFAFGNYRIRFTNPVLTVDTAGEGTLRAGVETSLTPGGPPPANCDDDRTWSTLAENVELVTFPADETLRTVDGDNVTWSFVPRWGDATPPNQFSPELLAVLPPNLQPFFQATAGFGAPPGTPIDPNSVANLRKVPAPISVSFSLAPPPPSASVDIIATVPVDGALVISVANNTVTLPPFALSSGAQVFTTSGALGAVTVTDTRAANPGWNVNAQLTDFVGAAGSFAGTGLGWTPQVTSSGTGQVVTPGATVAPGVGVNGSTLASTASGQGRGTALLDAALVLQAPTSTPAGTYTATLTLTTI